MKPSDQYLKIVEWSKADQCYVGRCPGVMLGGVHGDDEAKVYKELCQVVKEWIQIHKKEKIPLPEATAHKKYSGKFMLRLDSEMHEALAIRAMAQGDSLNNYCKKVLSGIVQV